MMKNVILIEDRIYRQRNLLGEGVLELEKITFLNNIAGGELFAEFKKQIMLNNYSVLDEYSTILVHRSALEAESRNALIDYLKDYNKKLVLFSGGITGFQVNRLKNMDLMLMNVTEFYSYNLLFFLKEGGDNLLKLAFGDNWETAVLIDAIDKLTIYEKGFNKKPWDSIEEDLKFNNVIMEKYFTELSTKSIVTKDEIRYVLYKMNLDLTSIL